MHKIWQKSQKITKNLPSAPPPTIKRELELKELPDKGQREERAVALATIARQAGAQREAEGKGVPLPNGVKAREKTRLPPPPPLKNP